MYCCNNTNNELFFSSIDEIPDSLWQELNCSNDLYFSSKYLSALEKNNPQIIFSYVFLVDNDKKPIAFATIQIVDFYLDSVQNSLQS
ncbi:MAG: GNAT family N-acetyltransferase, partial [Tenacibaculum sp.]